MGEGDSSNAETSIHVVFAEHDWELVGRHCHREFMACFNKRYWYLVLVLFKIA